MTERKPPSKTRARIQTAAGFLISILLLWWLFQYIDLRALGQHLRRISPWLLAATICLNYLSIPLRVFQWQLLLGKPKSVTFMIGLRAICLGALGNCIFPMRGGELLRTYVLAHHGRLPFSRVLTSVVLSRVQDFLPILTIAFLMFLVMPLDRGFEIPTSEGAEPYVVTGTQLRGALRIFALGVLGVAMGLGAFYVWRDALRRLAVAIVRRVSSSLADLLDRLLTPVTEAMQVIGEPRHFWGGQALAFSCWLLFLFAPVPLLISFGLGVGEACLATITITGMTTFAQLLPAAPGALGTFHAMCVAALYVTSPDLDRNEAMAYAIVSHAIGAYSTGLTGLPFLLTAWRDVQTARHYDENNPLDD